VPVQLREFQGKPHRPLVFCAVETVDYEVGCCRVLTSEAEMLARPPWRLRMEDTAPWGGWSGESRLPRRISARSPHAVSPKGDATAGAAFQY